MVSKLSAEQFVDVNIINKLKESRSKLHELMKTYNELRDESSPHAIDELKVTFISEYYYYANNMAHVQALKGSNHIFLEDLKRQVRQEYITELVSKGQNVTRAEKEVEALPEYVTDLRTIESIRAGLIMFDNSYKVFNIVINAMTQTISIFKNAEDNSQFNEST